MTNEKEQYAAIVLEVKKEFASKMHAGDEVSYEIAKRWAKAKGEKFAAPKPKGAADVPVTKNAPSPPGFGDAGGNERQLTGGLRIKTPE